MVCEDYFKIYECKNCYVGEYGKEDEAMWDNPYITNIKKGLRVSVLKYPEKRTYWNKSNKSIDKIKPKLVKHCRF